MPRCLVPLFATAALAAQAPSAERFLARVRDPSGAAVGRAHAELQPRAASHLPALAEVALAAGPGPSLLVATSDEHGLLRVAPPAGATLVGSASGLVTTTSGLGVLVFDLQPRRLQDLSLQPMAELGTSTGSETITVYARAFAPDGRTVTLAPRTGTAVRLPAGDFELWVHSDDGWLWLRRTLAPGSTTPLAFEPTVRRVLWRPGLAWVHPADRPDVPLWRDGEPGITLRGAAVDAPCVGWLAPTVVGPVTLPAGNGATADTWPPPPAPRGAGARTWSVPDELRGTRPRLFGVERIGERWHVRLACDLAAGGDGVPGTCVVPAAPSGDSWLVLVTDRHAPTASLWSDVGAQFPFAPPRGVPLRVTAFGPDGLPVADLAVDYEPADMEPAAVHGHTDARGELRLGAALAPGVLRVRDPRFLNQEIPLPLIPLDGVRVQVVAGATVTGTVTLHDGGTPDGVVVTLRDPRGLLQPSTRAAVTAADGSFVFTGLPAETEFVLFATTTRGGHTWSGRASAVRAGGEPVVLRVRDEDPELPGSR
jgi:hypothetical protein